MKQTLYKINLINKHGYIMYERYVVASGVNEAKRTLRESSPYYKGVKFKVVSSDSVLVSQPKEPKGGMSDEFSKRYDEAWEKDFGIKYTK